MPFAFEKLLVYQKAIDFADQITSMTEGFPRGYRFLADQLNRASLSVAANLAEGNGRFTKADRRHFFGIPRGSVQECVPLLELGRRRSLVDTDRHAGLKAQLEELARMLSGLMKGLDKRETYPGTCRATADARAASGCIAWFTPTAPRRAQPAREIQSP